MPRMPAPHRPQTLRQARRAYQRSTTVRMSASEKAQMERRAVLQARADRIKEREARRKANLKKREERLVKERESAKLAGRPAEKTCGIRNRPSQLDLAGFVTTAGHGKSEAKGDTTQTKMESTEEESEGEQKQPKAVQTNDRYEAQPEAAAPVRTPEVSYEDLLVSNTQILRELSPDEEAEHTATQLSQSHEPQNGHEGMENDVRECSDPAALVFQNICTQDLDMSDLLTQHSSSQRFSSPSSTPIAPAVQETEANKQMPKPPVQAGVKPQDRAIRPQPSPRPDKDTTALAHVLASEAVLSLSQLSQLSQLAQLSSPNTKSPPKPLQQGRGKASVEDSFDFGGAFVPDEEVSLLVVAAEAA